MKLTCNRLLLLIIFLGLSACSDGLRIDAEIRPDLRKEIDSLNKYVLAAFHDRQPGRIWKLASEELRNTDSLRFMLNAMSKALSRFRLGQYNVEHQLYSNKFRADSATRATFREGSEHEYTLGGYQVGLPTVTTFARIPEDYREFALVTSFYKKGGSWHLMSVQFGLFRILGMDAIDWHYRASQQDDADDLIDALVQQNMAMATLYPAGPNIRYKMRDEIERQQFNISSRAKNSFRFPIRTNPASNGAPQIIGASLNCDSSNCVPMFNIITNTPVSDTAAIRLECGAIAKNLDTWFNGVSNRNKVVAFRVMNGSFLPEDEDEKTIILRVPTVAAWRY